MKLLIILNLFIHRIQYKIENVLFDILLQLVNE